MDIRCRKLECKFNDRFTCRAKDIFVDRKVVCTKYEKDKTKSQVQDTTKHLFEKQPSVAPQREARTMKIGCSANCLFNHNGQCVSNGVTLNSIDEKPYCISFLKK